MYGGVETLARIRQTHGMETVGFIVEITSANEADELLPEEIEERTSELQELLLEDDHIDVTRVPAEDVVPGTRAVFEVAGGALMVVLAGRLVFMASQDAQRLAAYLRESAANFKSAAQDMRVAIDDFKAAIKEISPSLAARLSHFREQHPEVKTTLIFPQQQPVDVTGQSAAEIEESITDGIAKAAASTDG
jgi:hypothetical protein